MSGVDITQIDAIGVETVEVVLSEYGPDLSRFPTEKEFVAHVTLAPRVPSSGGRPLKKKKRNSAFAASQPDRPGSLLSQARSTAGRRCCSVRYRQEVGHADFDSSPGP